MVFGKDLLGVYLYGSAIVGGLQKYSDIDLFVVTARNSTYDEKSILVHHFLEISGIYMKSSKLPIELTIVNQSDINPWHYPPHFDFQYGDWLRPRFENGTIEPWENKEMPDLALLITQVLLASKTIQGPNPNQLLNPIPYRDFIIATTHLLEDLKAGLDSDTRNVLLTYARIWKTLETDTISSKPSAANWVIERLPENCRPVIARAKAICIGEEKEYWDDIQSLIQPCADFMVSHIDKAISSIDFSVNKSIKL